jgi:hypothetical protein
VGAMKRIGDNDSKEKLKAKVYVRAFLYILPIIR